VPGAWPVGIGHPCVGCTEQGIAFHVPLHTNLPIDRPTAPMAYPGVAPHRGTTSVVAVGVAGLVVGAAAGAGYVASHKLAASAQREQEEKREDG
jgi:hydrogenase small subunit